MSLATLRDIAVVLIAIEVFVVLLFPTILLFFVVRGLLWVQKKIRSYSPLVQGVFQQAAEIAETTSHKVATPVISVDAFAARVRRMRSVL